MTYWLVLLALIAPQAPSSASVQSTVAVHLRPEAEVDSRRLQLIAESVGGDEASTEPTTKSIQWQSSSPRTTMHLPAGSLWELRIEGEGVWSPTTLVTPEDIAAGELVVPIYPTTVLRIAPRSAVGDPIEDGGTLAFQPVSGGAPPAGKTECQNERGSLACSLPIINGERADLKLRIPGYASHFVWDVLLSPSNVDLGEVAMVAGGSIVGRMVTEMDDPPQVGSRVALLPSGSVGPATPTSERREGLLAEWTSTDERGFFQLEGLRPGSYRLTADLEGFAPLVTEPLHLMETREVELTEPLILRKPVRLEVSVIPPADEEGKPWHLVLTNLQSGQMELLDRGRSDGDGVWSTQPLSSGSYHLVVSDARGRRVAFEPVNLTPTARQHQVILDQVPVEGTVTLDGEPVPSARVYFGGRSGPVTLLLTTDDTGHFDGILPRSGAWDVEVEAYAPSVSRHFSEILVEATGSEPAWVELEMPNTELSGEVVDREDQPVEGAHVFLFSEGSRPSQTITDDHGEFAFHGLSPGEYRVEARRSSPEGSGSAEGSWVTVTDEGQGAPVQLVLDEQSKVAGTVLLSGVPVPGVRIQYSSPSRPLLVRPLRSDAQGRFELDVPPGVDSLMVTAMLPGVSLLHRQVRLDREVELRFELEDSAATTLEVSGLDAGLTSPNPTLSVDGVPLGTDLLVQWAQLHGVATSGDTLRIPGLPAASYQWCLGGECASGYLPPGGELELTLEEAPATLQEEER